MMNQKDELPTNYSEETKSNKLNLIYLKEKKKISENSNNNIKFFFKNIKNTIDNLHKKNHEIYLKENTIEVHKLYDKINFGDVPLSHLYNSLFNQEKNCEELNSNKSFFINLMESEQDYDISCEKSPQSELDKITPKFFSDNKNIFEFTKNPENFKYIFEEFSEEKIKTINFKYQFKHPILQKRFMGPSLIDVIDNYKICFISPKCFIIEIASYTSGYMLLDTFYGLRQYKFETEYNLIEEEDNNLRVTCNTTLDISFGLQFVKFNWLKYQYINSAVEDTDYFLESFYLPLVNKAISVIRNNYEIEKIQNREKNKIFDQCEIIEMENKNYKMDNEFISKIFSFE